MDIQQQKSWNVLLVGDACEDIYHYGVCERMSPEAPVPVFKETSQEVKQGMSSNVKLNLESLGINVVHFHNSEKIRKHRFIEGNYNQQLFRHDEGENITIKPLKPVGSIGPFDAVVVSDYDKGFITPDSFITLQERLNPSIPIFVDSKKKDLRVFKNCIIKINESEAKRGTLDPTQEVVVTLGGLGARWTSQIFKTEKVDVYDVCGAGDVFLAGLVYGYLKYGNMPEAITLANKCASLSVTKMGTYVLTRENINDLCI
jgi:D-beta-D-heptose 7-phosphate kinase/D-beta-D-heptose 1-phosphate adenosyltransferase